MKYLNKILFGVIIIFLFSFGKNDLMISNQISKVVQDTTKFNHQDKFQRWVDDFEKTKVFRFKDEEITDFEMLNTKGKVIQYSEQIILNKRPKYKGKNITYNVSEDKTKKLWFICATIPEMFTGGEIYIIVFKGNCKIIWYYETA